MMDNDIWLKMDIGVYMNPQDWEIDHNFLTRKVFKIIYEHLEPDEKDIAWFRECDWMDTARTITDAYDEGEWLEQNKNIKVSTGQTIKELEKFHKLSLRLADVIDSMHQPARERLIFESVNFDVDADVDALAATLRSIAQNAHHALSAIDESEVIKGRHKKHAAEMVTEAAAACYLKFTGLKPTLTVDPENSAVSGRWFEFLSAIFAVLRLRESPESQARAFMKKNSTKSGV